jgi:hypothetical protein
VTGADRLRSPDGRFRRGATGDLSWLDKALAPARQRARAVDGPATDPAPPAPEPEPQPGRGPSAPAGKMIPAGPMGGSPASGDLIRDTLRRINRR